MIIKADHYQPGVKNENLFPPGTMISITDKGLGPCLLPLDWYILQYAVQTEKGDHIKTGMSSEQCINYLKGVIGKFRDSLVVDEKLVFKEYFRNPNPNFRVGVLKLIPKIHKLKDFDQHSWKILPSRPFRGAENCPINAYSKTLCKLLQELHQLLKGKMEDNSCRYFPVIYGCDEYSERIQKVTIPKGKSVTLISCDFSDAYTKSRLCDLEHSIKKLGNYVGWPEPKICLALKLSKLVFENCFFETPDGIMKQCQGFPWEGIVHERD